MDVFTGIFAIVIGLTSLWFAFKFLKLYFKVSGWEKVEANVISKEVTVYEKYSTTRTPYKLNAVYNYRFNNQEFTGRFVYLVELMGGQANHTKSNADKRLDQIKGKMIVFVNPKNPKESVMYCEGVILYWIVFFMGLFAILIGVTKLT